MNCDPSSLMQSARCFECIPPGMQSGVRSYLLCQWANAGETCDPILDDYLDRLAAAGIAPADMPSAEQELALCNFCKRLRAAGIQDKFVMLNPILDVVTPNKIQVMLVPLILRTAAMSNLINHNFVAGDLTVNGLTGRGVVGATYLDTQVFCTTDLSLASTGVSVYESVVQIALGRSEVELGTENAGPTTRVFISTWDDILMASDASIYGLSAGIFANFVDTPGFYSANRTALNRHDGYYGSSGTYPNVNLDYTDLANVALAPIPPLPFFFMATNQAGVPAFFTTKTISFVAIHEGLTQPETADLFAAVQQLRIDLGGGFV